MDLRELLELDSTIRIERFNTYQFHDDFIPNGVVLRVRVGIKTLYGPQGATYQAEGATFEEAYDNLQEQLATIYS